MSMRKSDLNLFKLMYFATNTISYRKRKNKESTEMRWKPLFNKPIQPIHDALDDSQLKNKGNKFVRIIKSKVLRINVNFI